MQIADPALVKRVMSRISCGSRSGGGGGSSTSTTALEWEIEVTSRTKTGVPTRSEIVKACWTSS